MSKSISGFTVIELIVVITVIGIIASISIVSYNGVQRRAQNSQRVTQLQAWKSVFERYKANNGTMPDMPVNIGYCLGTGFPNGFDGVPRCGTYMTSGSDSYRQSDAAALMAALQTAATSLPGGPYVPVGNSIGPYAYYQATTIQLTGVFYGSGAGDCPSGTTYGSVGSNNALVCLITLNR